MKNRNRMLLISAAVASASAFAAGPQLVFDTGDENSYVVNISGLSRVEFREGGLNVVGQEERFLPYSGLGRVTIDHAGTHTPTSVRQVAETLSAFRIMTDRAAGTITLSGFGDGTADVMIFSTAGNAVMSIRGYSGGDIAVAGLPTVIYIVKTSAGNCAKFIK